MYCATVSYPSAVMRIWCSPYSISTGFDTLTSLPSIDTFAVTGLSVKITVPFWTTVISTSPKSHAISSFLANVISCVALLPLWLTVTVCVPSGTVRSISSVILRITLSPTSIQPFTK